MNTLLLKLIDSKLIICCSAACLVITTCLYKQIKIDLKLIGVVFCGTYLVYNLPGLAPGAGTRRRHGMIWLATYVLFAVVAICNLYRLTWQVQLYVFHLSILAVWYYLPFQNLKLYSLRSVPLLKIFIISYVWTAVTAIAPLLYHAPTFDFWQVCTVASERFLFIFAIAMLFDIQDLVKDTKSNLVTFPVWLGKRTSTSLSLLALILSCMISFTLYHINAEFWIQLIINCSIAITVLITPCSSSKYVYGLLVDGIMIVQLALLILCRSLLLQCMVDQGGSYFDF